MSLYFTSLSSLLSCTALVATVSAVERCCPRRASVDRRTVSLGMGNAIMSNVAAGARFRMEDSYREE